jgi:hypothetical protein
LDVAGCLRRWTSWRPHCQRFIDGATDLRHYFI